MRFKSDLFQTRKDRMGTTAALLVRPALQSRCWALVRGGDVMFVLTLPFPA